MPTPKHHRVHLGEAQAASASSSSSVLSLPRLRWACLIVLVAIVGGLMYVNSVLSAAGLDWSNVDPHMIRKYQKRFSLQPDLSFGNYCDPLPPFDREPEEAKPYDGSHIMLLSFPRSGNHLARGVIECLIDTPTFGHPKESHFVLLERSMGHEEASAVASKEQPFVRKLHGIERLPERWEQYEYGLIYQVRDPVEAVLSENRNSPYFWRQYHHDMDRIMSNTAFFLTKPQNHRVLLYFEDYYTDPMINIRKLQRFFGKDIVSDARAQHCYHAFRNISSESQDHLQRSSHTHSVTQYADQEFGRNNHPQVEAKDGLYDVMSKYGYFHRCSARSTTTTPTAADSAPASLRNPPVAVSGAGSQSGGRGSGAGDDDNNGGKHADSRDTLSTDSNRSNSSGKRRRSRRRTRTGHP